MSEFDFDGLLMTIIETHREAEIQRRKLWARIWLLLFLPIFALIVGILIKGGA